MKIAFLSDFDLRGSGYKNLSSAFCEGLMALGHEVKAIGFGYFGQEHDHTFTLIPSPDMKTSLACIYNLRAAWQFDVLVVALDIPIQNLIIDNIQNIKGLFKYVGIMPIEADPLCQTWAMILLQMDLPLIISHFGVEEAHKANVLSAKYIQLGIDSDLWKSPTPEEKKKYRKRMLNVQDDETFVVLTVADN